MKSTLYICILGAFLFGCKEADIDKIELAELNGDKIDMTDYRGKIVFVNFWATWCGPCIKEMPAIEEAQTALNDKEVVFLIASNEEVEEIEEFSKERSLKLHYVRVLNFEQMKIPALPTTYIFDREGKLKFSETGARQWNEPENLTLITK